MSRIRLGVCVALALASLAACAGRHTQWPAETRAASGVGGITLISDQVVFE